MSTIVLFAVILGFYRLLSSLVLIPATASAFFTFYALALRNNLPYVLPGPQIQFGQRRWLAFQVCACVGLAIGVAINISLGLHLNLPLMPSVLIALIGISSIPLIAIVSKIISGVEQLCFYYAVISVPLVSSIVLLGLGQPILPFLDILMLATGAARAFGYFGCLKAGCCHGRPSNWGVVYPHQYAVALSPALLGVRLFPVQVFEALWTSGLVVVGCIMVFNQAIAGTGVTWFIVTYCSARFCFECLRWPPNYEFRSGLSQHQWISVALVFFIVSLELTGVLPFQLWHSIVLIFLLLMTAGLVIERRTRSASKLMTHPQHVRELLAAIDLSSSSPEVTNATHLGNAPIQIARTSLGLQISGGKIAGDQDHVYHYTLSSRSGLSEATVNSLAQAITRLQRSADSIEVFAGNLGVFHLLLHSARREGL